MGCLLACTVVMKVDSYCRPGAWMGININGEDFYGAAAKAGAHCRGSRLLLSPSKRRGRTKVGQQDDSICWAWFTGVVPKRSSCSKA